MLSSSCNFVKWLQSLAISPASSLAPHARSLSPALSSCALGPRALSPASSPTATVVRAVRNPARECCPESKLPCLQFWEKKKPEPTFKPSPKLLAIVVAIVAYFILLFAINKNLELKPRWPCTCPSHSRTSCWPSPALPPLTHIFFLVQGTAEVNSHLDSYLAVRATKADITVLIEKIVKSNNELITKVDNK